MAAQGAGTCEYNPRHHTIEWNLASVRHCAFFIQHRLWTLASCLFTAPHLFLLCLLFACQIEDMDIVEVHHAWEVHLSAVMAEKGFVQRQAFARPKERELHKMLTVRKNI